MISRRRKTGVKLPFGTDSRFGDALAGDVGYAYGEHGPSEVGPDGMVVLVDGEPRYVPIPEGVQWAEYAPVTQRVKDAAEDAAGRPSKLGEVLARDLHKRSASARAAVRRDVLQQLDAWAAAFSVNIVITVDTEGLDEEGEEKAMNTARKAALNGLASTVARSLSMPGLAARAARLERLVARLEAQRDAAAVDELVGAVRAMLNGVPRPLTEDDLDDVEHQALTRHRRRTRDIMQNEARLTVSVVGWDDEGPHFDELEESQQAEALSHVTRLRYLPAPKERVSSPASG